MPTAARHPAAAQSASAAFRQSPPCAAMQLFRAVQFTTVSFCSVLLRLEEFPSFLQKRKWERGGGGGTTNEVEGRECDW